MNRPCLIALLSTLALALLGPVPSDAAWPKAKKKEEPVEEPSEEEQLSLVALLIQDGHWDRAALVFEGIDPQDEGVDASRYHTLAGLLAFQREDWPATVRALSTARELGVEAEKVGLYMALAYVNMELYQTALVEARPLLGERPETWSVLAEALRQGGRSDEALLLLEEARLRFPDQSEFVVQLAGAQLETGQPLAAALLLERSSLLEPGLALEAAECFRRSGRLERALLVNLRVADPVERYRQRLGLALEAELFEQVVALVPRLERAGLMVEDQVRFAVAYAQFRVHDLAKAKVLLAKIEDPGVFSQTLALREALIRCEEDAWTCP